MSVGETEKVTCPEHSGITRELGQNSQFRADTTETLRRIEAALLAIFDRLNRVEMNGVAYHSENKVRWAAFTATIAIVASAVVASLVDWLWK